MFPRAGQGTDREDAAMTPTELKQTEIGPANLRVDDAPNAVPVDDDAADEQLLDELLVEEVSIDGMCGVY
jgi:mycofactocin precursor